MPKNIFMPVLLAAALSFAACSGTTEATKEETKTSTPEAAKAVTLADVVAHPRRAKASAADKFRNPAETLAFFEVGPGKHVAEVWPGYYTSVLAPYIKENGGTYTAVIYPFILKAPVNIKRSAMPRSRKNMPAMQSMVTSNSAPSVKTTGL